MTASSIATLIPGPPTPRLLGWRGRFIKFLYDPVAFMLTLHRDYGQLAASWYGNRYWTFAFGPEYNHQVLSDSALFNSIPFVPQATPRDSALGRLSRNLLSMNGDQHRQQRRLVLPAFHRRRVETYRDQMVAHTQRALDGWRVGQHLDIAGAMRQLTLCIATDTLFGLDATAETGSVGPMLQRWLTQNESIAVQLLQKPWPGTPFHGLMTLSERLEARIQDLIRQKRANMARQHDMLTMLIQARDEDGGALTDAELTSQTSLIFVASHETSSNALTWTLFLLSQHPRVLADLTDELDGLLRGAAPTVEQLGQLPLLERVIKESLRLLPPATFIMRAGTAPFQLGPYELPWGSTVALSPYVTHRMPELYSEPQRFLPERWSRINPSVYEYVPFGAGPHMCLGTTFAMMEIKIVLAMLLQRYQLALNPGARIDRRVAITMSPKHGMPMIVAPPGKRLRPGPARGNIREMVEMP